MTNKRNRNKVQKLLRVRCGDPRLKHGYMDKIDFTFELGEAAGGNRVYGSVADIKEHQPCAEECGIVKVAFVDVETIQEEDFKRVYTKDYDSYENRIKHAEGSLARAKKNVLFNEKWLAKLKAEREKETVVKP